ncbi:flagellar basal body-associated FliL family protein [Undibacterium sp. SXout7W]|uniref:flagellar basal body-associated FliL family protein n=1 Tax=Undibacterium sp. SXout7W TaxID=3413049 RepID=UPI003BF0F879
MSSEKSKPGLLTEKLDFEAVDSPVGHAEFDFASLFDAPVTPAEEQSSATAPPGAAAIQDAANKPSVLAATPGPGIDDFKWPEKKKTASVAKEKNDHFGRYAAIIALIGFIAVFLAIFYVRSNNDAVASYIVLPQTVANINDQVIRIQVTIQVAPNDRDWLQDNKKLLTDLFKIEAANIDPDDLHSEEGFDKVREAIKVELNKKMNTDKIESVLINQLLTQSR